MLVVLLLIFLPIVSIAALLIVPSRLVVLKRTLQVLAALSPAPLAWVLSSYVTRFQQNECYADVLWHVQSLSLQYSETYGDRAHEEIVKALGPYMHGYETDCAEALDGVRAILSRDAPPGAVVVP